MLRPGPSRRRAPEKFRGWRVVGAGLVIQWLQSAVVMHALGAYMVKLEEDFGWSKSALSGAYAMNRTETALLGPVQGWLLDRYGPRRVARVGTVFLALGFVGFSQTRALWQFYASFLLVSVGAGFCGLLTVTVSIVRWFERRRARALAIGGTGFALGGACVPLVALSITAFGWRWTAAVSGLGASLLVWWLAAVLEGRPADFGQEVDGGIVPAAGRAPKAVTTRADGASADADKAAADTADAPSAAAAETRAVPVPEGLSSVHFTASEAIRTRAFWMISLGHMSALFVVGSVMAHLQLFLTAERGYTLGQASLVAGMLPLVQLVGMALGGWLGDRVNKRLIASVAMCGHAAGLLILAWSTHVVLIGVFVGLHGLAWGARGPLMQALRADYFGSSSFGSIMGISSLIVMMGTAAGPLIAGVLADATGSYRAGFTLLAVFTAMGMTFFVLAKPPAPPPRHRRASCV